MSLVYWLSRFSQEAMLVELFLIGVLGASYFGYLLTKKRKYGAAKANIPDNVVRAFLVELMSNTEGFKNQLFGENFKMPTSSASPMLSAMTQPSITIAASPGDSAELTALKSQFAAAIVKQDELNKAVAALLAEKTALEGKLAAAPAAGAPAPAAASGDSKELQDKIAKLESKLAEYEVIEDDLANLKKYQQENKQLRAQLDAQKGGAAPAIAAAQPAPPAPAPEAAPEAAAPAAAAAPAPAPVAEAAPSPIAAAEASVDANAAQAGFEGLVDKVEESLAAPPAGASVADPAPAQAAPPAPAPEAPEPAAAAAEPAAATPAAAEAAPPKAEKSDADLLNEFERMLSS